VAKLDLAGLQVYGEDERWVRRLLSEPTNSATLRCLLGEQARDGLRELYVQPDRLWLRARPSARVTAARVGQWLDDLLALASAVEAVD
jgi:hypothetical protein